MLHFFYYPLQRIILSCLTVFEKCFFTSFQRDKLFFTRITSYNYRKLSFSTCSLVSFLAFNTSWLFFHAGTSPPPTPGRDRRKSCASRRTSGSEATREYESYDISDEKTHYESPHGSIFLLLSFYSYLRSIIRKLIRKQVCRKGKYLVTLTPKRPCHRNNLRFSRETSIVFYILYHKEITVAEQRYANTKKTMFLLCKI